MIIGVDGMGGDYAPKVIIDAVKEINDTEVWVIGNKEKIGEINKKIISSDEEIGMKEFPREAFKKKNSSISVGINLLKEGKINAFVGAGNTGAYVIFSVMELGKLSGVKSPALGAFFPTKTGYTFVIDVGAIVNANADNLYQFGIMGSIFVEKIMNKERPKVGLLSVGEEETKGGERQKSAFYLLKESKINFIGNVEGHTILDGIADVVVCDGFVGNAILKFGESMVEIMSETIKEAMSKSIKTKLGAIFIKNEIKRQLKRWFYQEYGGAILLGINGAVIICHGRSNSLAIKNAIYTAKRYASLNINESIINALR